MRISVKILITILLIFVGGIIRTILVDSGAAVPFRVILSFILLLMISGVWSYKPKNNNNNDLDKTI